MILGVAIGTYVTLTYVVGYNLFPPTSGVGGAATFAFSPITVPCAVGLLLAMEAMR